MKRRTVIFILGVALVLCGCAESKKAASSKKSKEAQTAILDKVESIDLAKVILKPERPQINAARDPFKPLVGSESFGRPKVPAYRNTAGIHTFKFLGLSKINDEYAAFLKSDSQRGIYKTGDRIKNYTVKKIREDKVILSNGVQTVTLRRSM